MTDVHRQSDYDQSRLTRLLGGAGLDSLRQRLRRRYELGRSQDVFTLSALGANERQALEGLLGRRARQGQSMTLSLSELDEALARAGIAQSLREALERLDGPIRDVAAERAAREAQWQALFDQHKNGPLGAVLDAGGRGLVKRLAGDSQKAGLLLAAALRVLERLPQPGVPLAHLAAHALGDAHALDEGQPIATLVLAALGRVEAEERPRERWARHGLLVNELAAPVLALNLPAQADTPGGRLAAEARALGEPLHFSLRQLLRLAPRWQVAGKQVFVCENPAIVAIAADRLGRRCPPLVCTDGMPSAAQRTLLMQLGQAGGELLYHGDYDWPGISIGNFVIETIGARPWRFSAEDYDGKGGRPLEGQQVFARWDGELSAKMLAAGCAIDEEAAVDVLIDDLAVVAEN